MRYFQPGTIFSDAGGSLLCEENDKLIAFLNTKVCQAFLNIINQTLNYVVGSVAKLPVYDIPEECANISRECIELAKEDWDSFECSWDFKKHPLVRGHGKIEDAYDEWENECFNRFSRIKKLEEQLNQIFIDLYGMHNIMNAEVADKDISIKLADRTREIKSVISFAVGCIDRKSVV